MQELRMLSPSLFIQSQCNCQKCNQCLKCQVSGHKCLGLILRVFSKCHCHCLCLCLCLCHCICLFICLCKFFLVMSCLLITLNKCLKGHKSLGWLLGGVFKMVCLCHCFCLCLCLYIIDRLFQSATIWQNYS